MKLKKLINVLNSIITKVVMTDLEPSLEYTSELVSVRASSRITLTQFMNEFNSYMTWISSQSPSVILIIGLVTGYLNGSLIALMIPKTISYLLGVTSFILGLSSGYVFYSIDLPIERFNQLRSVTITCVLLSVLLFIKSVTY
jgi:hypothetical protein